MATKYHDYQDLNGDLLYRVIRKEDPDYATNGKKTFYRVRFDGEGNEVRNWNGVKIVPYNLKAVEFAKKNKAPLIMVEGEKDVDNLASLQLPSTTIPGGSNAWSPLLKSQPEFPDHFRDTNLFIIPDNDEAGEKFAETSARVLNGTASQVAIVRLPGLGPGGDISDWFENGGSREELYELLDGAEGYVPQNLSFSIYENLPEKTKRDLTEDVTQTFVKVRSQLQKIKQTGANSFDACCPSHQDKEPSLTVTLVDGKVLMHCHAGCPFGTIVDSLGMEKREFFRDRTSELRFHQTPIKELTKSELEKSCQTILGKRDIVGELPCKDLPPILSDYLKEIEEISDAQKIIIASTTLASLGTAIGTKMVFNDYFDPLYPNLWCLTLSQSGSFKTTALNIGASALRSREKIHLDKLTESQTYVSGLIDSGVDKNSDEVKQEQQKIIDERTKLRILPAKGSWEGIIEQMNETGRGIWLLSEMGAWLSQMEGKHNNRSGFKASVTELYDVPQSWTDRTILRGHVVLRDPFMAVCGVSTLEFLHGLLTRDDAATGFLARFLIFRPPKIESIPPALPSGGKQVKDLNSYRMISALHDQLADTPEQIQMTLEPNAKMVFEKFHDRLHRDFNKFPEEVQPMLEPFVKRWSPTCLKLAMLMQSMFDSFIPEISDRAVVAAMEIIRYAINSTQELFDNQLGLSDHQRKCKTVLEFIAKRGGSVERRKILQSRRLEGGKKDYDYVLETLMEQGMIVRNSDGSHLKYILTSEEC